MLFLIVISFLAVYPIKNFVEKLMKHSLGKWTVRGIKNGLNGQAQRVEVRDRVWLEASHYWFIPGVDTDTSSIQHPC